MTIDEPVDSAPGADPVATSDDPGPLVFDVTDATFEALVVERSRRTPVVVDLWAPWCGPCVQLSPLLERLVEAQAGEVVLAKINVDENPQVSGAFGVQSIPAVYGLFGARVVDSFIGARGEDEVRSFIGRLMPSEGQRRISALLDKGDEASLREVLELDPPNESAILGLAELLATGGDREGALEMLNRVPDSTEARRIGALARAGGEDLDDADAKLDALLDRVKDDPDARQEFLDLLELLGPDDPRVNGYRKALTAKLF